MAAEDRIVESPIANRLKARSQPREIAAAPDGEEPLHILENNDDRACVRNHLECFSEHFPTSIVGLAKAFACLAAALARERDLGCVRAYSLPVRC